MNIIKINQHKLIEILTDKQLWPNLGLDLNKGYCLIGHPGVGKTFAMKEESILNKVGWGHPKMPNTYSNLRDLSTKSIFSSCETHGPGYLQLFAKDYDMWLDDLGFEPKECNCYGTKFSPIQDLIFFRHKLFPKHKTNFTTNLTHIELRNKYGEAILSRLAEMCNFIVVEGLDRRMNNNFKN